MIQKILNWKYRTRIGQLDIRSVVHYILGLCIARAITDRLLVMGYEDIGGLAAIGVGIICACVAGGLWEFKQNKFEGAPFDVLDWIVTTIGGLTTLINLV